MEMKITLELSSRVGSEIFLKELKKFLIDMHEKTKSFDKEFKDDKFWSEFFSISNEDTQTEIRMEVMR